MFPLCFLPDEEGAASSTAGMQELLRRPVNAQMEQTMQPAGQC